MLRVTCLFGILLSACTQGEAAKDFYDDAETGSTWQLTPSTGTHVDGVYGPDYYKGACPAIAAKNAQLPTGAVTGCEADCTCTFQLSLSDDGDVGHSYVAGVDYEEQCTDGSHMQCFNTGAEDGGPAYCTWVSGTIDPSVDPFGDCSYTLDLVRED